MEVAIDGRKVSRRILDQVTTISRIPPKKAIPLATRESRAQIT